MASREIVTTGMIGSVVAGLGGSAGPGLIVRAVTDRADQDEQAASAKAKHKQVKADREQLRVQALEALERDHKAEAEEHKADANAWWVGLDASEKYHRAQAGIPSPHPARRWVGGERVGTCPEAGQTATLVYLAWKNWQDGRRWAAELQTALSGDKERKAMTVDA